MDKYYYDIESEQFISIDELKELYFEFEDTEEITFPYYINCCMTFNNGCLETLKQRKQELYNWIDKAIVNGETKTDYQWMIDEIETIRNIEKADY